MSTTELKRPKVLLLNPPGDEIYIRDYYCSKISKTTYVYTPVDLLMMSARLTDVAELVALDAIGEKIGEDEVVVRARAANPDVICFLTSAVSWNVDLLFLSRLRRATKARIIASGDVLMENPEAILGAKKDFDAILTDFTSEEIAAFAKGEAREYEDIVWRDAEGKIHSRKPKAAGEPASKTYDLPMPRHDLFPMQNYRYPFVRRLPFATVLTDFGCAFKCSFCIQSFLEFKARSSANVLAELRLLKEKGFREIYFSDQTFAYNPQRAREIFQGMIDEKMGFGWVAFYRVDLVREDMLKLMKEAGCHTLMFGIENASEELLREYKKSIKLETVRSALALCRKHDIRTVGTFILGFPHETREDIEATIRFSLELPLDYVSYNLPVPRSLTDLRRQAVGANLVSADTLVMDQSGKFTVMGNEHVSAKELHALRNQAIRRFYLRPTYLLRRLLSMRTWDEVKINILDGLTLLNEAFSSMD